VCLFPRVQMVLREIADEAQLWIAKGVNGLQSLA